MHIMHNFYFRKETRYPHTLNVYWRKHVYDKNDNVEYILNEDAVFLPLLVASGDHKSSLCLWLLFLGDNPMYMC